MGEVEGCKWYLFFTNETKDSNLSDLLHEKVTYYKLHYPFLPLKQVTAKAYEELGIPHNFGIVDKALLHKMYLETRKCDLSINERAKKKGIQNFHKKLCFSAKRQSMPQTLVKASENSNPEISKVLGMQSRKTPLRLRKSVRFNDGVKVIDISPNCSRKHLTADSHKSNLEEKYLSKNLTAKLVENISSLETSSKNEISKKTGTPETPNEQTSVKNTLAKEKKDKIAIKLPPAIDSLPSENKEIHNIQQPSNYLGSNHLGSRNIENFSAFNYENDNSIEVNQPSNNDKEHNSHIKSNIPETLQNKVVFLNNLSLEMKSLTLNNSIVTKEINKIECEKEISALPKPKKLYKKSKYCKAKNVIKTKLLKKKIPSGNLETHGTSQFTDSSKELFEENPNDAKHIWSNKEISSTFEFNQLQGDNFEETNLPIVDKNQEPTNEESAFKDNSPIEEINYSSDPLLIEEISFNNSYLTVKSNNATCFPQSPENIIGNDNESVVFDKFHKNLEKSDSSNVVTCNTVFNDSSENVIENENSDEKVDQRTINEDFLWSTHTEETGQQNLSQSDNLQIQENQSSSLIAQELPPKNSQEKENSMSISELLCQSEKEMCSANSAHSLRNYEIASSKRLSPDISSQSKHYKSSNSQISLKDNLSLENSDMEYPNKTNFRESKIAQFRNSENSSLDSYCSKGTNYDGNTRICNSNDSQSNLNSESISYLNRATKKLNIIDNTIITNSISEECSYMESCNKIESFDVINKDHDLQKIKSSMVPLSILHDSSLSSVNRSIEKIENDEPRIPTHLDGIVCQEGQAIELDKLNENDVEDEKITSQRTEKSDKFINDSQIKEMVSNEELSTAYETEKETGRLKINKVLTESKVYLNIHKKYIDKEIIPVGSNYEEGNRMNSLKDQLNISSELDKEFAVIDWLYNCTLAHLDGKKNEYSSVEGAENCVSVNTDESKSIEGEEIIANSSNREQEINHRKITNIQDHENCQPKVMNFNKKVETPTRESGNEHTREELNSPENNQVFQERDSQRKPLNGNSNSEQIINSPKINDNILIFDSNYHVNKNNTIEEKLLNPMYKKALHLESDVELSQSFSEEMADNENLRFAQTSKSLQTQKIIHSSEDYSLRYSEAREQNEKKNSISIIENSDSFETKELKFKRKNYKINKFDLKTGKMKQEDLNGNTKSTGDNLLPNPLSTHSAIAMSNIINSKSTNDPDSDALVKKNHEKRSPSVIFSFQEIIHGKKRNHEIRRTRAKLLKNQTKAIMISSSEGEVKTLRRRTGNRAILKLGNISPQTRIDKKCDETKTVEGTPYKNSEHSQLGNANVSRSCYISSNTEHINLKKTIESIRTKSRNLGNNILSSQESKIFSEIKVQQLNVNEKSPKIENSHPVIEKMDEETKSPLSHNPISMREALLYDKWYRSKLNIGSNSSDSKENDHKPLKLGNVIEKPGVKIELVKKQSSSPIVSGKSPNIHLSRVNVENESNKKLVHPENVNKKLAEEPDIILDSEDDLNISNHSKKKNRSASFNRHIKHARSLFQNDTTYYQDDQVSSHESLVQSSQIQREPFQDKNNNLKTGNIDLETPVLINNPVLSGSSKEESNRSRTNRASIVREENKELDHSENMNTKVVNEPEISKSVDSSKVSDQLKKKMSSISFSRPNTSLQDENTSKYFEDNHDLSYESPVQPKQLSSAPLSFDKEPFQDISNNLKTGNIDLERPVLINSPVLSGRSQEESNRSRTNIASIVREENKKLVHSENMNTKVVNEPEIISTSVEKINRQLKKQISSVSFNRPITRLRDKNISKYLKNNHEIPVQPKQFSNSPLRFNREPFQDITNNLKIKSEISGQMPTPDLNFNAAHPSATISHAMEIDSPNVCSESDSSSYGTISKKRKIDKKILKKELHSQLVKSLSKSPLPSESEIRVSWTEHVNTEESLEDNPTVVSSKSSTVRFIEIASDLQDSPQAGNVLLRRSFFMEKPLD